jgi:hypothetical protein
MYGVHPAFNIRNKITYWEVVKSVIEQTIIIKNRNCKKKIKAYGQLVLLGFDVTTFTPVAYQRHSL